MQPKLRRLIGLGMILAAVGLAVTLFLRWREPRQRQLPRDVEVERRPRSVLLVTVDTTRADRLQPYGADNIATPTFQRLADRGILFERAASVAPITLVAHTSILSGLYPPSHGVRNNGIHFVPEEIETLSEILGGAGYRTAAFVSAAVLERRYGLDQGFEVYDDDLSAGRERHPRMVPDRPAEATVDSTVAWLDGLAEGERFFAWTHFYDPHANYSPPPPYRDDYRARLYDGEIAYMDAQIGRLLQHPRLAEDVVVVVLGDHGESLGEHREQTHAILAYDSTLHVPFILRIPGGPSGVRVPREVSQVDLAPTLLDLLDLEPGGGDAFHGRSLMPLIERPRTVRKAPLIYSETYLPFYTYGWAKLKAVRRDQWKYIAAPTPELYDLRRDPRELSNQIEQNPGAAHDFERDLGELLERLGDPEREASLALDTEAMEKLRSLGYLAVGSGGGETATEKQRPDPKAVVDLHVGLERSRRMLRDRLYDEAVKQLRAVLQRDPDNLAALIDLASALEAKGDVDEAVKVVERALQIDPRYTRLHLLLAGLENRRGKRDQALELIEAALEIDPRSLEARIQKAFLLRQLGRSEDAVALLAEALEENAENPRLNAIYAQVVEMPQSRFEDAETRLRQALDRDPFLVLGWRLLGELLERTGRGDEAVAAYASGLERQPDDAELHSRLGQLLARRGAVEAEVHLREAIRLAREPRAEVRVSLGGWLAERGRLEEAEREYNLVLGANPEHPGARNNRAIARYLSGRVDEAVRELESLTEDFPRHAEAHNNLSAIAVDRGDWARAERRARRALDLDSGIIDAWNNLGVALLETGRLAAAGEAFEKALEIDSGYWKARFNLAVQLTKRERHGEAAAAFHEVVAQVPHYAESHYELGNLYAGPLGDPAKARTHYNAFLSNLPGDPRAAEVRRRLSEL